MADQEFTHWLVYWCGSNYTGPFLDPELIVSDDLRSLDLHGHVYVRSDDSSDVDSDGNLRQYKAHIWSRSNTRSEIVASERELMDIIEKYPWSEAKGPLYCSDHCAACMSMDDYENGYASDQSAEMAAGDGATASVSAKRKAPAPTEPSKKKKKKGQAPAEEIQMVVNGNSIDEPLPREPLPLNFVALNDTETEQVRNLIAHFNAHGSILEPDQPSPLQLLTEQFKSFEKSVNDRFASLQRTVARMEKKQTSISDNVAKILGILEDTPRQPDEPTQPTPPIARTTPGLISASISEQYDDDAESTPASTLLDISNQTPSTPHSAPITLSCGQMETATNELPAPSHISSEPTTPLTPLSARLPLPTTWLELGFPTDPTAEKVAVSIDFDNHETVTKIQDQSSNISLFGSLISSPSMTKSYFVRSALRHIFPPSYFVGRNTSGRMRVGLATKQPIHPQTLRTLCLLANRFCPNDQEQDSKIRDSVNRWLRDPRFKSRLAAHGLVVNGDT